MTNLGNIRKTQKAARLAAFYVMTFMPLEVERIVVVSYPRE